MWSTNEQYIIVEYALTVFGWITVMGCVVDDEMDFFTYSFCS
jgi:hypothetical protein